LGRCIREDPDAGIRADAVGTLARIAEGRREPCPLVIIEAMLDKDEQVSQTAGAQAGRFKTFAPGTVDVLLRCAGSDDPRLRGECLGHLARAGGKNKKALEVIEKATRDKSFGVRHNARVAMFQATDDLGEFLAYLICLQEDPDGVLGPVDADSEAGKRERTTRDLASLGAAMLVVEWSDRRPDDLAPALLKLLAAPSPTMRRGAARLIGASAVKVDLADHDWDKLLVGPPEPPKAQKPPQRSNAAVRFEKLKAEDRLRELRDGDPDHTVRAAAHMALERFATVREKGPAR
jgi:HEAT repeat protein